MLEYITPTQVVEGVECLWRLGFSCDPKQSGLNRSGPAAALGTAAHEVVSRLGDSLGFDAVWTEAVARASDALALQWAPAVTPSPEIWPGWSLTKVRLKKLWEGTASKNRAARDSKLSQRKPGKSDPPQLPWRERWIRHRALPLAGRPDLVERVEDSLIVVDLKTGLKQAEPTDRQRTQLLLYCELVKSELGHRPALAAIESSSGKRFLFPVNQGEIESAVRDALGVLEKINSRGQEGLDKSLAQPSASACGWCPFRPTCSPFFDTYDATWAIPHALLFRIESVVTTEHGYQVEATVLKPYWRQDEDVHLVGFPFESEPFAGEVWGAVDFVGRANSAVAAWNTRVAKWTVPTR